jgi:hypothetical protein
MSSSQNYNSERSSAECAAAPLRMALIRSDLTVKSVLGRPKGGVSGSQHPLTFQQANSQGHVMDRPHMVIGPAPRLRLSFQDHPGRQPTL